MDEPPADPRYVDAEVFFAHPRPIETDGKTAPVTDWLTCAPLTHP
jgi:hypothetical protein